VNSAVVLALLVCAVSLLCLAFWRLESIVARTAKSILSRLDTPTSASPQHSEPSLPPHEPLQFPCTPNPEWHIAYGQPGANIDVSLCPLPSVESLRKVEMPDIAQRNISDFAIETAKLFGQYTGTRTLAVQFSPEVARQLANGQLELMKSALAHKACAIDPNNGSRIVELGNISPSINPMAAAAFALVCPA
jgi:hypothetical protein